MVTPLYVVNKLFRSALGHHSVGTILTQEQLEEIRLWPLKLKEAKIIELPTEKAALEKFIDYCEVRHGVDFKRILEERASKGSEVAAPGNPSASTPTTPGTIAPKAATTKPAMAAVKPTASKPLTGK
jgi:hypothetical protein